MGTIFIEYQEKGFWIDPFFIEVLSDYICQTFETIGVNTFSQKLQNLYVRCDLNRKGQSYGMVNILFDKYVTNPSDTTALIDVLTQTKSLILSIGTELSIELLTEFESRKTIDESKSSWVFPIKTSSLAATIDIIIQMLNGTWVSDNYSVHYTGFPNFRNMPEI
jgi:hypothetical protein